MGKLIDDLYSERGVSMGEIPALIEEFKATLAEKDAEVERLQRALELKEMEETLKPITVCNDDVLKENAQLQAELDRVVGLLSELHTVVRGECPSLLNEDSGGDAELDWNINKAIRSWRARQGKELK